MMTRQGPLTGRCRGRIFVKHCVVRRGVCYDCAVTDRVPFDSATYSTRIQTERCFICRLIADEPTRASTEYIIHRDDQLIAFLSQPQALRGHVLVAPIEHREQIIDDLSAEDYLRIQEFIQRLGKAMHRTLPVERLYVLSLGSQQGNSHAHWHVAPLPPGVPLEQQQFAAMSLDNGYFDLGQEELSKLADQLTSALRSSPSEAR